jgi:hypothetical protein
MDIEAIRRGPPLTIGLILGGAWASRAWEDAVKQLMRRVKFADRPYDWSCGMQVVFDVAGEVTSPAKIGVMFPRQAYKRAERRIYMGIGLPEHPEDDAYGEAVQFLWKAVEEAKSYMTRKGIPGDLNGVIDVVRGLEVRQD